MKTMFRFMVAAFALVASVACAEVFDEPTIERPQELERIVVTVDGDDTRTFIGDDGKSINWCEDDVIAIYDGYGIREFTIVEGSVNGKSASFEGEIATGATTLRAIYPYSAVELVDGALNVTSLSEQQLDGRNVTDGAMLSIAEFERDAEMFTFNNAMGFLRVNITKDDVSSIIVNGLNIAGVVELSADGTIAEVVNGANSVTLRPVYATFAVGTYYVALLPGTTPAGQFKMTFVREGAAALEMVAQGEITVPRNAGFNVEYAPATEKFVITDVATLEQFLSQADSLDEATVVDVVNDIDLQGAVITSAKSFAGTLNGNGYSILNWTSDGVALFESLSGSVVDLRLDATCSLTAPDTKGAFGFIAKSMTATAVLDGVENYADVTLASTLYGAGSSQQDDAIYFGVLVGESLGTIQNCKNNGNVTITSTPTGGDERGLVYIGGVVGKADGTIDGCINSGDISYSITGRGGYLFMGGVTGGTTAETIDDVEASFGTIRNCQNTGNIYHTFDNQIVGSGSIKSNYINMAGVAGYWIGSIEGCMNGVSTDATLGKIQLAAPTLATGDGYSAANVSVAGVSCYAYDVAKDCNNYGTIEVDGSFGPGYETYIGGGNREDGGTFIAGVVAQIGAFDTSVATHEISNCHNYGVMDVNLPITSTSSTNYKNYHYVGGVVAYANATANNLSNNATINLFSQGTMNYVGGVIGQTDEDATAITNNGDIIYAISRVGGQQLNNANQLFGGVIGYNTGDQLTNITNNNPVSLTVDNTNQKVRFGGVAGSFGNASGVTNNGAVTYSELTSHAKEVDFGGVAGATTSGSIVDITNNGAVAYTGLKMTGSTYVAGVVGYAASTSCERAYNYSPINISAEEFTSLYAAGIVGSASSTMTDVANHADVTLDVPTIKTLYLAGVTGSARSATEYHDCLNEGALYTEAGATLYLAGIAGHSGGNVKYYDSVNSGAITLNGANLAATELNVAGICARPYAKSIYDGCTNNGSISVTANSASKACYLGGIAAQTSNASSAGNSYDVENCSVTGDIFVDCKATWYIGGAIAFGSQWSSTASNHRSAIGNNVEADITIASTTTAHYVGGIIGHSGVHVDIADNSYTGTITVNGSDANKSTIGGIVGALVIKQTGSSTQNAEFSLSGNTVNGAINFAAGTYGGMLLGAVDNLGTRYTSELTLSLDENIIAEGSSINGVAITADNLASYVMSDYDNSSLFTLNVEGIDTTIIE